MLLRTEDLIRLTPLWYNMTREMRFNPVGLNVSGWYTEMMSESPHPLHPATLQSSSLC